MYVCMYVCIYIYIYMYTFLYTDGQMDRRTVKTDRHRQIHRGKDSRSDREGERGIEKQRDRNRYDTTRRY